MALVNKITCIRCLEGAEIIRLEEKFLRLTCTVLKDKMVQRWCLEIRWCLDSTLIDIFENTFIAAREENYF